MSAIVTYSPFQSFFPKGSSLLFKMKVVFHMAKNDIQGHQYVGMTVLLRAVQAPDFTDSEGLYRHSESICDMEMALEDVVLKGLEEKIRASDYIGIIIDPSYCAGRERCR
ncbi:unnamed protein product [Gadus morhua 'NCC']